MSQCQPAVLRPVPVIGRYLTFAMFDPSPDALRLSLRRLADLVDGTQVLAGLGAELVQALGAHVPGLRPFTALAGPGVSVPATHGALCCWLRGDDMGALLHLTRRLQQAVAPALVLRNLVDGFRHGSGRDLTGYEDGTENPVEQAALDAAVVQETGSSMDGSSFMTVQQWQHDFDKFEAMPAHAQDHMVGRRRSDNEELDDAPASAHVKRTAQESFDPTAFVLRRSMPWVSGTQGGLVFVAFGCSFAAFEAQMQRMAGLDDGVVDAMFGMSKPLTGANFWCPPLQQGRLDLRQLDL